jgi:uncharacterized protein (DUF885 family)
VIRRSTILAVALGLAACAPAPEPETPVAETGPRMDEPSQETIDRASKEFSTLRDGFLEWYYETRPVRATELGIHRFDAELPELDRAAMQRRIDDHLDWLGKLENLPFMFMRGQDRFEYAVLEYALRGELLDLEEVRSWAVNPRVYTQILGAGLSSLVEREFAPVSERAVALQGRMEAAPSLLAAARENLRSPPRIWTELAIEETRGLIRYLGALPAVLEEQAAEPLGSDGFEVARQRLVDALASHAEWLETDLLPRATGDFRLGRYLFLRKVLYEEHVDIGIQELDRLNAQSIRELQGEVERLAGELDPARTARAIMDSLVQVYPGPDELLPAARRALDEVRVWVGGRELVTIPAGGVPLVREAPAWRAGAFASLDAPGLFDSGDLASFLDITPADTTWPRERQREYLTYFSDAVLPWIVVHETFPGRYVQHQLEREASGLIRKTFEHRTLTDGWSHYAEQLLVDEGFRGQDPGTRLGHVRRALQYQARWYAAVHLHAMDEPVEDVVQRVMQIAYLAAEPARREVVRATYDPMVLAGALGRIQVIELRKDYQEFLEKAREDFSLVLFHDTFLKLGLPPTLAREALMPPQPRQRALRVYR